MVLGGEKGDSRFFTTQKKGELHELRMELHSTERSVKVDAVKKVIASMTVGKDVSMLFTDVLNCVQTGNIELKKLVYLYLINYAKTQPELTLLAVNTFVKDASDANPLIRALAVRTMGCIRVDRITEYLCEPLSRALRDDDPYVRKTAAVCVAKLYDIAPDLVVERGFLQVLHDLISDSNPSVVANSVAALSEIAETSGKDVMKISASVLQKLLAAINECTEWGQVFILDSLAKYTPADGREAEGIIERVTPRLQHANSAVVMSAVKVILSYMELMGSQNADAIRALTRKLAPPLVTLLNSEPEIQYVALRNINLIVQKRPHILENEIKVFFCKYNDPIYVKMEKLEIIIKLVSERNVDQVLLELKEYSTEVDVDFVRKSVSAIGRCAVKLERAAERCIGVLLELIQTKVNYVVQESVIIIKNIFRRYPGRYESIIATLCDNLDTLDEPMAKASMIWIIGEYAERIDNADELLDTFLETFEEEDPAVQLQLLTATVKCFLKSPDDTQEMVQRVLDMATEESDNPDLRDRGFIYWRLLSTDPEAAKMVVLGDKPVIEDDTFRLDPALLNVLIEQIATLSSVYHKPPDAFVVKRGAGQDNENENQDDDDDDDEEFGAAAAADQGNSSAPAGGSGEVDLLDMGNTPHKSKMESIKLNETEWPEGIPSEEDAHILSIVSGNTQLKWAFHNGIKGDLKPALFWRTPHLKENDVRGDSSLGLARHLPQVVSDFIFGVGCEHPSAENAEEACRDRPRLKVFVVSSVKRQSELLTVMWRTVPSDCYIMKGDDFFGKKEGRYDGMGVDRLAAVFGGVEDGGDPCLVFDAGTALTYTATDRDGNLIGGGIAPGLSSKLRALSTADGLPYISPNQLLTRIQETKKSPIPTFCNNTQDAMISSILSETASNARRIITQWLNTVGKPTPKDSLHSNKDREVILTGGDADILYKLLSKSTGGILESKSSSLCEDPLVKEYTVKLFKHLSHYGIAAAIMKQHRIKLLSSKEYRDKIMEENESLRGQRVAREDKNKIVRGTISEISLLVTNKTESELSITILYDSGEKQTVDMTTLQTLLQLYKQHGEKDISKRKSTPTTPPSSKKKKTTPRKTLTYTDPKELYNKRVAKYFETDLFFGTVMSHVTDEDDGTLWQIEYDDGDAEDFDIKEVTEGYALWEKNQEKDEKAHEKEKEAQEEKDTEKEAQEEKPENTEMETNKETNEDETNQVEKVAAPQATAQEEEDTHLLV